MEELIARCCSKMHCDEELAEAVIKTFLHEITDDMCEGKTVELGDDFGKFMVKFVDGYPQPGSPRYQKTPRYKVTFRPGHILKKRLKLPMDE